MRRTSVTASELLSRLALDPEYQERRANMEQRRQALLAEFATEEAEISKELQAVGYAVSSVWDLVNNVPHAFLPRPFTGSYERAYPILVAHLGRIHHKKVREGLIRALTVRDGGHFVAEALLHEFYQETDRNLKWVLANALRIAMPLKQRKLHPEIGLVYHCKNEA